MGTAAQGAAGAWTGRRPPPQADSGPATPPSLCSGAPSGQTSGRCSLHRHSVVLAPSVLCQGCKCLLPASPPLPGSLHSVGSHEEKNIDLKVETSEPEALKGTRRSTILNYPPWASCCLFCGARHCACASVGASNTCAHRSLGGLRLLGKGLLLQLKGVP